MVPILLLFASPASAITGSVSRSVASGALASATFTWNPTSLAFMTVKVSDLACDNNDVYVDVIVQNTSIHNPSSRRYRNSNGCNTTRTWTGEGAGNGLPIAHMFITVCIDDFGSDTCASSSSTDNPYT